MGRAVLCVKGPDRGDDYALEYRIFVDGDVLLLSGRSPYPALKRTDNITARMQGALEKIEVKKL
jgi:hypothetical protein